MLAEACGVAICRMRRALGLGFRLGAQDQRAAPPCIGRPRAGLGCACGGRIRCVKLRAVLGTGKAQVMHRYG